jgi:hypothetical protein
MKALIVGAALAFGLSSAAKADVNLWVDDLNGNIGLVDVTTQTVVAGSVHNTGEALTDIAFVGDQMYGTSFTGLFKINDATGASTLVGNYSVGGGGMNALVGSGTSLLAASNATNEIYTINPNTAGAGVLAPSPLTSAGDLAFDGKNLFLSANNLTGGDSLVNISTNSVVGVYVPGEAAVFGLANDGTTTYAIDGTEVFSVNTTNAHLTPLFNYGGDSEGLVAANGTAFIAEGPSGGGAGAIPEPSTWAMMGMGFGLLAFMGFKRSRKDRLAVAL